MEFDSNLYPPALKKKGQERMWRFEVYKGDDLQWYWRLRASNGETVCSSEGYTAKQSAIDTIKSLRTNVGNADIVEVVPVEG